MVPDPGGAAWPSGCRASGTVALNWIGDGGTSTGAFHEGLNFACVQKAPLRAHRREQQVGLLDAHRRSRPPTRASWTAPRAYGCFGEQVDGNDVLAVYEVTRRAIERAREGEGPTLIEADTMRMRGHAEHDDMKYVPAGDGRGVGGEGPDRRATSAGCSRRAHATQRRARRHRGARLDAQLAGGPGVGGGRARCPTPRPPLRDVYGDRDVADPTSPAGRGVGAAEGRR